MTGIPTLCKFTETPKTPIPYNQPHHIPSKAGPRNTDQAPEVAVAHTHTLPAEVSGHSGQSHTACLRIHLAQADNLEADIPQREEEGLVHTDLDNRVGKVPAVDFDTGLDSLADTARVMGHRRG